MNADVVAILVVSEILEEEEEQNKIRRKRKWSKEWLKNNEKCSNTKLLRTLTYFLAFIHFNLFFITSNTIIFSRRCLSRQFQMRMKNKTAAKLHDRPQTLQPLYNHLYNFSENQNFLIFIQPVGQPLYNLTQHAHIRYNSCTTIKMLYDRCNNRRNVCWQHQIVSTQN